MSAKKFLTRNLFSPTTALSSSVRYCVYLRPDSPVLLCLGLQHTLILAVKDRDFVESAQTSTRGTNGKIEIAVLSKVPTAYIHTLSLTLFYLWASFVHCTAVRSEVIRRRLMRKSFVVTEIKTCHHDSRSTVSMSLYEICPDLHQFS